MKMIKNWVEFFESKNYTEGDKRKDDRRIDDMLNKAKDKEHLLRLARTMANSITNYDKAYNRGLTAEKAGLYDVAEIFLARASELKGEDDE